MNNKDSSLKIIFANIFLFSSLFPFVTFRLFLFDTQPYTFLIGLIGIAFSLCSFHINRIYRISFLLVLIALFISSFSVKGELYYLIRGLYNYLSLFFYLFIFSYFFKNNLVNKKIIKVANYIYILFAFLQLYFPSIINIFLYTRTANKFFGGRGLSSLTPEPFHFGAILILFSLLILIKSEYNIRKDLLIHVINLISIFTIARSATLILVLSFSSILAFTVNIGNVIRYANNIKNLKYIFFLSILFTIFIFYSIQYETRIFSIISTLIDGNFKEKLISLLNVDRSISGRLEHLIMPFLAFYKDFGLPHAFDGMKESSEIINPEFGIFWDSQASEKFMSFMGDYVFSLGIFGIISALLLILPLILKNKVPNYILIIFITLLATSVPVSTPLVPAVLAGFYYGNNSSINYNKYN